MLGSLKEKYLKEACKEYEKRLSRYCNLEIIEIEPVRISDKPSQTEIENALKLESIPNKKTFDALIKKSPKIQR